MPKLPTTKTIIGRAEKIELLDLGLTKVPAKTDTGADTSSIWASSVEEKADGLYCIFFGKKSPFYSGEAVHFPPSSYTLTRVANSFGHAELRYKVKLRIRVNGRLVRATFTLSDRSLKTYPILLGRRLLHNKFLVDVTKGEALHAEEKKRAARLRKHISKLSGK
jgi:hypothetical protein